MVSDALHLAQVFTNAWDCRKGIVGELITVLGDASSHGGPVVTFSSLARINEEE